MKKEIKDDKTTKDNKKEKEKADDVEVMNEEKVELGYDFENLYKRAIADYQNLKRRCEEDKKMMMKFSNEVLITKLLTVVSDLELASNHSNDEGIKKIYQKLMQILSDDGVECIDPIDSTFDSLEHEAVESLPGENGKVVKVLQKGFKLNSKVLKPAIVAVGNGE